MAKALHCLIACEYLEFRLINCCPVNAFAAANPKRGTRDLRAPPHPPGGHILATNHVFELQAATSRLEFIYAPITVRRDLFQIENIGVVRLMGYFVSEVSKPVMPFQDLKKKAYPSFSDVPRSIVGGLEIAALDGKATARLMIETALARRGAGSTLLMSSANGEVLSRCASDPKVAKLFAEQHLLSADGQPLVLASRKYCKTPLPERVATTDLFHIVAPMAIENGATFYMYGAAPEENEKAIARVRKLYPALELLGSSHGYLSGHQLEDKIDEINGLKPDILWVALGVPREQEFCHAYAHRLGNVGIIKTSGGLFNFLSGSRKRAPTWMQRIGLEWAWRIKEEPRRLFARYAKTNFHAFWLLIRHSQ